MSDERIISSDDLHAYADDQLPPERRAKVEAHLAAHPDDAERVAEYRRINEELHSQFDPVMRESVPARLRARRRRGAPVAAIAAGLAALLIGAGAGWLLRGEIVGDQVRTGSNLAGRAMAAHTMYTAEVRHPVEVWAAEYEHLVRWLSNRLGDEVTAPDLEAAGFTLIGGRLLPGDGGPAAQFMYENEAGERLTLYLKRGDPTDRVTAFRYQAGEKGDVIWWIDGPMGYALAGPGPRGRLQSLAHLVQQSVNP